MHYCLFVGALFFCLFLLFSFLFSSKWFHEKNLDTMWKSMYSVWQLNVQIAVLTVVPNFSTLYTKQSISRNFWAFLVLFHTVTCVEFLQCIDLPFWESSKIQFLTFEPIQESSSTADGQSATILKEEKFNEKTAKKKCNYHNLPILLQSKLYIHSIPLTAMEKTYRRTIRKTNNNSKRHLKYQLFVYKLLKDLTFLFLAHMELTEKRSVNSLKGC